MSCCGYQIHDIAGAAKPAPPELERRFWYQYYFHGARGRAGLEQNRRALCRLLWQLWSPSWDFDEATYQKTASSFDNPDFVDVVIHSYRHRFGLVDGDDAYAETEAYIATQPRIDVPTIVLHGDEDGVMPAQLSVRHAPLFGDVYERRVLNGVGHNPAQEDPQTFAQAVLDLLKAGNTAP